MSDINELLHLLCREAEAVCTAPCTVSHRKLNQQLHHFTMFLNISSLAGLRLSFKRFHLLILITSDGVETRAKNVWTKNMVGSISCTLLRFRERFEANLATPLLPLL